MCAGNFAKKNKICNFVLLKKQKTMNEKIALVAVAYNRTNSLARLLKSLERILRWRECAAYNKH